jgi:hypothetical protein
MVVDRSTRYAAFVLTAFRFDAFDLDSSHDAASFGDCRLWRQIAAAVGVALRSRSASLSAASAAARVGAHLAISRRRPSASRT